jgi:hypothetical protein
VVIVDAPGQDRFYLLCLETERSAPQLIRRWRRRHWIEHYFRTLKHLLATGACQVHGEDAYYGHLVLRLLGCLVLFYTLRVICKGRLTMEEIIFSLKHYWRFVDCEALELKALSQGMDENAAWIQAEIRDRRSQYSLVSIVLIYYAVAEYYALERTQELHDAFSRLGERDRDLAGTVKQRVEDADLHSQLPPLPPSSLFKKPVSLWRAWRCRG